MYAWSPQKAPPEKSPTEILQNPSHNDFTRHMTIGPEGVNSFINNDNEYLPKILIMYVYSIYTSSPYARSARINEWNLYPEQRRLTWAITFSDINKKHSSRTTNKPMHEPYTHTYNLSKHMKAGGNYVGTSAHERARVYYIHENVMQSSILLGKYGWTNTNDETTQ